MKQLIKITSVPMQTVRYTQNARLVSSDSVALERRKAIARQMSIGLSPSAPHRRPRRRMCPGARLLFSRRRHRLLFRHHPLLPLRLLLRLMELRIPLMLLILQQRYRFRQPAAILMYLQKQALPILQSAELWK